MTCGLAVKRPHEYEAYLGADVEVKRSRPTHCSPFRAQLGTLAASLPQSGSSSSTPPSSTSTSASNNFVAASNMNSASPFAMVAGKCQLSNNQLEDYLRTEVRYLKRRRLIPRRAGNDNELNAQEPTTKYRRGGTSPTSSHSGSDSESENHNQSTSANGTQKLLYDLYERPQFSMNQVKLICERLLKEQETRLRYEYETVLNRKLDEKHEEYVQFAKEQLESRPTTIELSYLS